NISQKHGNSKRLKPNPTKKFVKQAIHYFINNDLLYRKNKDKNRLALR
ncbi:3739_t:CDS:1, partial [Racocetra persica]